MRLKLVLFAAASTLIVYGAPASAQSADELLKSKGCLTCHAADAKKVGPSFKDIASKHAAAIPRQRTSSSRL
jgi:cytochrome c